MTEEQKEHHFKVLKEREKECLEEYRKGSPLKTVKVFYGKHEEFQIQNINYSEATYKEMRDEIKEQLLMNIKLKQNRLKREIDELEKLKSQYVYSEMFSISRIISHVIFD